MHPPESTPAPAPGTGTGTGTGPDHRHLLLLIVGLIAGLLCSPYALGRIAPHLYNVWLTHGSAGITLINNHETETAALLNRMTDTGVTQIAIDELIKQRAKQRQIKLEVATITHIARLQGILIALILIVVTLMLIETLFDPPHPAHRYTIAARYALMSIWIALIVAQPRLLEHIIN